MQSQTVKIIVGGQEGKNGKGSSEMDGKQQKEI